MSTSPEDMAALLAIRDRDPDGWQHREPTEQDYAAFDKWVADNFGKDMLDRYKSNWDERSTE